MKLPDPQKLSLPDLPSLALRERARLPNIPAIYFVLDSQQRVLYIGRSKALCVRWLCHGKLDVLSAHEDVHIAWLAGDAIEALPAIERLCIEYFQPPYNVNNLTRYKLFSCRLPADLCAALEAHAAAEHRSINAQIVYILSKWLAEERITTPRRVRKKEVADVPD